jgi:hypothetical protein
MNSFQAQKQEALELLDSGVALAQQLKDENVAHRLETAAKQLAEGKLVVVVAGEFKQGKSSLINALLDERENLFPVDVDIATNLVTTITYGEEEDIRVLICEAGNEILKHITREEIGGYVTEQGNPNNQRQARMLIIQSPNPRLKEGLVLVDTPGVGGLNVKHTEMTYALIPTADAILFLSDALKPLTEIELEFVAMIARHCPHVIYAVTKKDVGDWRSVLDSNREKLAKLLVRPIDSIPLIAVSSQLKLAYLKNKDPEDFEDSNFRELERELWERLNARRGQILVTRALVELGRTVEALRRPLLAEWETCRQKNAGELNRMESELVKVSGRHKDLLTQDAAWRTELSRGLADIRDSVFGLFHEGFPRIRYQAESYLGDERLLARPEQIANLVETNVGALMVELAKELGQKAMALHARIEASTELNVNPFEVMLDQTLRPQFRPDAVKKKVGWWPKVLGVARSGWFMCTSGAMVGGFVGGCIGVAAGAGFGAASPGWALGQWIGSSLGGLAGATTGAKQALEQYKERDKAAVWKVLSSLIDECQRSCGQALSNAVKDLERSMQDDFVQQLRREKEIGERTLKALQEARKRTHEEAARKETELKAPLQRLEQLIKHGEGLLRSVSDGVTGHSANGVIRVKPEATRIDLGAWADDA